MKSFGHKIFVKINNILSKTNVLKKIKRSFGLIEISIILFLIDITYISMMKFYDSKDTTRKTDLKKMQVIEDAIDRYFITKGYLPSYTGTTGVVQITDNTLYINTCDNGKTGKNYNVIYQTPVPYQEIGVPEKDLKDAYGYSFVLFVNGFIANKMYSSKSGSTTKTIGAKPTNYILNGGAWKVKVDYTPFYTTNCATSYNTVTTAVNSISIKKKNGQVIADKNIAYALVDVRHNATSGVSLQKNTNGVVIYLDNANWNDQIVHYRTIDQLATRRQNVISVSK